MLPQFTLAALHLLTFKLVSIITIYHLLLALILAAYPWIFFFAIRRFGLTEREALMGALFSLLPESVIGFGHEFGSYLAFGSGVFTQLFAMAVFPWALALGHEFLTGRRRAFLPVVFFSVLMLSHVFLAYLAFLLLGFAWLFGLAGGRTGSVGRFAALTMLVFLTVSFFLVPLVVNSAFHAASRYEPLGKMDSYGMMWAVAGLIKGSLFDAKRLPILSLLAVFGLVLSGRRSSGRNVVAFWFVLSFFLFFGRTTWRGWADLLPMGRDLHFERFILGIHFFGAALAGIGAAWLMEKAMAIRRKSLRGAAGLVLILALVAVLAAPYNYLRKNGNFVRGIRAVNQLENDKAEALFDVLEQQQTGRIFAGMRGGWGTKFRLCGIPVFFLAVYHNYPVIGHLAFGWSLSGDFSVMINDHRADHLDLFNITHILSWKDDAYWGWRAMHNEGSHAIYKTIASGYFDVVATPFALVGDKYTYWNPMARWMKSPLPGQKRFVRLCFDGCDVDGYDRILHMKDPHHFTLRVKTKKGWSEEERPVYGPQNPFGQYRDALVPGRVLRQAKKPPWTADIEAANPATVVLKMTYHPFWRVKVDGRSAKPIMVSPGFVAVEVPAGVHQVAFTYRAARWKWALLLLLFLIPTGLGLIARKKGTPVALPMEPDAGRRALPALVVCALILLAAAQTSGNRPQPLEREAPVGEWLRPGQDERSVGRISIDGITFDQGISKMIKGPDSWTRLYNLDGRYKSLEAWAGLTDGNWACSGRIEARFDIWVDDEQAFSQEGLKPSRRPRFVGIDLTGKKLLKLQVTPTGEANCVEAAWAQAVLYK